VRLRRSAPRTPPPGGSRRRRDRHGRGLRGALVPARLPGGGSRADAFDDLAMDGLARLTGPWGEQLRGVELVVEEVPPDPATEVRGVPPDEDVPLGRTEPATRRRGARLVLYRRPIEARARSVRSRADLIDEVVVWLVADLLGLSPDEVDPDTP